MSVQLTRRLFLSPASFQVGRRPDREESDARFGRNQESERTHVSVLLDESVDLLSPRAGETVLDATAGSGGHSEALLETADVRLIALDADPQAVARVKARLSRFADRATVIEANFKDIESVLNELGIAHIDKALFDLGWNKEQLFSGKGFSFRENEPLLMSYGEHPASGFTAADILNTWSEQAIADALFGYGEERYARRIAKKIIDMRRAHPITTTAELIEIIASAVPAGYRRGRTHFATKTFQALRIAVNDELGNLQTGLRGAWKMLAPGGRLAVITFHSIEDRQTKRLLKEFAQEGGALVTKKPITPSRGEVTANRASRSAKLRVIEKLSA